MMRIDKLISNSTSLSRKEIKSYIKKGLIVCDGETVKNADIKVDENKAEIYVCGEKVVYAEFVYLMLNKPDGYVSATYDKKLPVVTDLVPEEYAHFDVFPVGRLDIDTHGLLLLTNDGELAHKLLSPKSHVPKTYYVESDSPLLDSDIKEFEKGICIDDEFTAMGAKVEILEKNKAYLTIYEGKFHQVKRMYEAVDKKVTYLKRISMGNLRLDENLKEGEIRELTANEVELLSSL